MSATSALFRRYIEGYTIGELPKVTQHESGESVQVDVSDDHMRELGYVRLGSGEWVHHEEAVCLPQNGRLMWVRMG